LEPEIRDLIASKNLEQHFSLTGFRGDVDKLLPGLDIFLFTSKQEGFGTSLLDAFAAGVPVVATKVGGIPEIVQNEVNGLLAEAGDSEALAKQVLKLLQDPQLRQRLKRAALQRVRSFSTEKMAERTREVYQSLI
jgi:glycosyltransferase involved in cell wall biosynthesis